MLRPETRYAKSGDVHIAYQVLGHGPFDVVFVQGFISNLEVHWEDPGLCHLFSRLGSFSRLVLFDKRGSGLSDRVTDMPDLQTRMDDVRAVMDATGSQQAALIGASEGGPMCILFAATYPERTRALVLYGSYAHFHSAVLTPAQVDAFVADAEESWGTGRSLKSFAPNLVSDERFRAWWARFERLGTSPAGAIALARMNARIDVRGALTAIRVPTLVIHRRHDARVKPAAGRYLARHIRRARYVELPGVDHPIWVGDTDRVVDEIEEFLTGARPAAAPDSMLATLVHALVGGHDGPRWRGQSERFQELAEPICRHYRGREAGRPPDGFAAMFDGPVRALRCAMALREAAAGVGIPLRTGVQTGEVELTDTGVRGLPCTTAARIAATAQAGEILVAPVVADLVSDSAMRFRVSGQRLSDAPKEAPSLLELCEAGVSSQRRPELAELSPREKEVLAGLAHGLTNAAIADRHGLSEHTVKRHVANILLKLDLANRSAAAAFAVEHGLATGVG